MTILFADYDRISHDQRALETIESVSLLGDVTVVSIENTRLNMNNVNFISAAKHGRSYLLFLSEVSRIYRRIKPDVVFFHDDYCAPLIRIAMKGHRKPYIIYDSSELHYDRRDTLKRIIIEEYQRKYIGNADLIFAANIERAKIMKDYYKLDVLPSVIDNIHRIDDEIDLDACNSKYSQYFEDGKTTVLYCGGIKESRDTFRLMKTVDSLGQNYQLLIAGTASDTDIIHFKSEFEHSKNRNSFYLGFLPRSDLKYLLGMSQISVSLSDYSCANHIFCASGKVYESLFEGTPILTSTNPPLMKLCEEWHVGVSTDDYSYGIQKIIDNYDYYVDSVSKYIKTIGYDNRVNNIAKIIEEHINEAQKY